MAGNSQRKGAVRKTGKGNAFGIDGGLRRDAANPPYKGKLALGPACIDNK